MSGGGVTINVAITAEDQGVVLGGPARCVLPLSRARATSREFAVIVIGPSYLNADMVPVPVEGRGSRPSKV